MAHRLGFPCLVELPASTFEEVPGEHAEALGERRRVAGDADLPASLYFPDVPGREELGHRRLAELRRRQDGQPVIAATFGVNELPVCQALADGRDLLSGADPVKVEEGVIDERPEAPR